MTGISAFLGVCASSAELLHPEPPTLWKVSEHTLSLTTTYPAVLSYCCWKEERGRGEWGEERADEVQMIIQTEGHRVIVKPIGRI